jgi:hypothetical protein
MQRFTPARIPETAGNTSVLFMRLIFFEMSRAQSSLRFLNKKPYIRGT